MIFDRRRVARAATALALAATATVATASTASAHPLTCFVNKTAPYYDSAGGTIIAWIGAGQGMDLESSSGIWRGGRFWGGDGRKIWMQAQNLNGPGGGPC
ncbi:hypothetical protein ACQEVB_21900 [Pseudonocardia sp. CA-107938]|uniref:hypothetical protein n=1 Tax=Pseudonocardia sp. CA-107938 TaxID=3240021 RepID=UPI003D8B6E23